VLADGISIYAASVFAASERDIAMTFFEAWAGALAYSLQLYFDFSGYSDMAIGLARMFGVRLPINFNSPFKATSIIDFWQRWHMTLSRFFRDYIYIPLSGNRRGEARRLFNLMITMLLGGLWHGAGWTFVLWGGLHGVYLVINHSWRILYGYRKRSNLSVFIAWVITMLAVVAAWVPFRAESMDSASNILFAMAGGNKISLPSSMAGIFGNTMQSLTGNIFIFEGMFNHDIFGIYPKKGFAWVISLLCAVIFLPSTQQIMHRYRPALVTYEGAIPKLRYLWMGWRPAVPWALFIAGIFIFSVISLTGKSEFLYFHF